MSRKFLKDETQLTNKHTNTFNFISYHWNKNKNYVEIDQSIKKWPSIRKQKQMLARVCTRQTLYIAGGTTATMETNIEVSHKTQKKWGWEDSKN